MEILQSAKNKRILAALVIVMTMVLFVLPANAASLESDFVFDCTTGTITGYSGAGGDVEIPDTIGGVAVTGVGTNAFSYCTSITSITIPDGVTSIGDFAFYWCTSITSITIPDSVTSIGVKAFYECTSLTSITIPDGVTSIGDYAFPGCTSLTSVTIPDSVTSIGASAFYNCTSLTSVTIPNSVTSIADNAFCNCTSLASVTLPDSVTSIGASAFETCTSLTSITIPNSITSIPCRLFYNCTSLTSVTIPNSVTSIADYAFSGCTSLASVTIPDSVTSIGINAFYNCTSLTSVTIPNNVTSISIYTFYNCTSLASVTIPNSVTSIGMNAFSGCTSLASVTIPDSVTSIGTTAFSGCTSLESAEFMGDAPPNVGDSIFSVCAANFKIYYYSGTSGWTNPWNGYTTVKICTVQYVAGENGSLSGCTSETVYEGESPTSVPTPEPDNNDFVFKEWQNDNGDVVLPSSEIITDNTTYTAIFVGSSPAAPVVSGVEDGQTYAGAVSASWDEVTGVTTTATLSKDSGSPSAYVMGTQITDDGSYTIVVTATEDSSGDTAATTVNFTIDSIPPAAPVVSGVEEGQTYAQVVSASWSDVAGVTTGATLSKDGAVAETYTRGAQIPDNGSYTLVVTATKDSNQLEARTTVNFTLDNVPPAAPESDFVFDSTTGIIADYKGAGGDVVIPCTIDSVAVIGIGNNAFVGCTSLTSVTIPGSVTSIGDAAFYGCTSLVSVTMPDRVTRIGASAFSSCTSLASVTIPNSVTSIGRYAFSGCTSLASVEIPGSVTSIGDNAFSSCTSLASVTIPGSVTSIGGSAFSGCTSLASAEFMGDAPLDFGDLVFCMCAGNFKVYYYSGTSGWTNPWNGYTTVKICTVQYVAAANGSLLGSTSEMVYEGESPTSVPNPAPDNSDFVFKEWQNEVGDAVVPSSEVITDNITYTALFVGSALEAPDAPAVSGVADGMTYVQAVSASWDDAAGVTIEAMLSKDNGCPGVYDEGTPITEDGYYELVVLAIKDSNQLEAETTVNFTIDSVPPAIITSLTSSTTYSGSKTFTVAVTDEVDSTPTVTVRQDSTPIASNDDGTYTVYLSIGTNIITITAEDDAGNTAIETREIIRKRIPPTPKPEPTPDPQPQPEEKADGTLGSGEQQLNTTTEETGQGKIVTVEVTVTPAAIEDAVEAAKKEEKPVVVDMAGAITPPEQQESEEPVQQKAKLTLTPEQVGQVADTGLAVKGPQGTQVELPQALLGTLAEGGQDLSIEISKVPTEKAKTHVKKNDKVYEAKDIDTNFSGETQLRFTAPPDANPKELKIKVIHSDGTIEEITPTVVTDADGNAYLEFTVDKFSTFIVYKPAEEEKLTKQICLTIDKEVATINGEQYTLDAAPFIKASTNRTLVPVRFVSECLGAKVEWVSETRQVLITNEGKEIILTIDSDVVLVDGVETQIDSPAEIVGSRTFVPLRFVSETLGAEVEYKQATRGIVIVK